MPQLSSTIYSTLFHTKTVVFNVRGQLRLGCVPASLGRTFVSHLTASTPSIGGSEQHAPTVSVMHGVRTGPHAAAKPRATIVPPFACSRSLGLRDASRQPQAHAVVPLPAHHTVSKAPCSPARAQTATSRIQSYLSSRSPYWMPCNSSRRLCSTSNLPNSCLPRNREWRPISREK